MEIMREGHQDENTDDDEEIKISKFEKTTNSEMKKQKNERERERSRGRPTVNGLFQNFSPVISFRLFGLPEHKNPNQEKKSGIFVDGQATWRPLNRAQTTHHHFLFA